MNTKIWVNGSKKSMRESQGYAPKFCERIADLLADSFFKINQHWMSLESKSFAFRQMSVSQCKPLRKALQIEFDMQALEDYKSYKPKVQRSIDKEGDQQAAPDSQDATRDATSECLDSDGDDGSPGADFQDATGDVTSECLDSDGDDGQPGSEEPPKKKGKTASNVHGTPLVEHIKFVISVLRRLLKYDARELERALPTFLAKLSLVRHSVNAMPYHGTRNTLADGIWQFELEIPNFRQGSVSHSSMKTRLEMMYTVAMAMLNKAKYRPHEFKITEFNPIKLRC